MMSAPAQDQQPQVRTDRPLNILSIATTYPRWARDTEPSFVHDLNRALATQGHRITALVPHAPRAAEAETLEGVQVLRFRYAGDNLERIFYEGGALPNLRHSWRARIALPGALRKMRTAIRTQVAALQPDLLHVHWLVPQGFFALKPAEWAGIPLVVTAHGADVFQSPRSPLAILGRKVVARADALTANTSSTATRLLRLGEPRRLVVIPMGLDLDLFKPSLRDPSLRQRFNIRGPWILAVGRMVEKKGFSYLLQALPEILTRHPGAILTLLGTGPLLEDLKHLALELGLAEQVTFLGAADRGLVAACMASADCLVGPSVVDRQGDTEAQGVVFVEAQASGCPVIATTVGGIPDVVRHGETGILVPPRDSKALAQAVSAVLEDRQGAQERAARAKEEAARYSWPRIASEFEALFHFLTKPRQATGG